MASGGKEKIFEGNGKETCMAEEKVKEKKKKRKVVGHVYIM